MSSHHHVLDPASDPAPDSPWPALAWIALAATVTIVAFLMAPLP